MQEMTLKAKANNSSLLEVMEQPELNKIAALKACLPQAIQTIQEQGNSLLNASKNRLSHQINQMFDTVKPYNTLADLNTQNTQVANRLYKDLNKIEDLENNAIDQFLTTLSLIFAAHCVNDLFVNMT